MNRPIFSYDLGEYYFLVYNGIPDFDFFEVKQIHSDIITNCVTNSSSIESDGLIAHDGETLAIKTADCLPVAYIGNKGTALIHAGWKGVKNGILTNDKLLAIEPYKILIGPHIGLANYEVGSEFLNDFDKKYFKEMANSLYLDLSKAAIDQLFTKFSDSSISDVNICTFENHHYNSYRRNKTEKRNYNILKRK